MLCERGCVLFVVTRTCVLCGHCLYPGAVLPVRSQVFISLDSGRRITGPQAATHPSFPGLPKTSLQHALFVPMLLQTKFSAAFHWFTPACRGTRVSVKRGCGDVCRVACIFRGTTLFSLNSAFPCATLNDTVPGVLCLHILRCAVCHLELVSPVFVCIFVCASLCVVVAESAWLCGILGKIVLKRFVPELDFLYSNRN